MSTDGSKREVLVGLVVAVAAVALLTMVALASNGPGYLASNREIDVLFRDGQGLRPGSAVRIAGIDAGRVTEIDLVPQEGNLMARVRISLPSKLAKMLKQDVKVTIQPGLTGQSRVNIVSSGRSDVGLVPGQSVMGVESTFFDPILEQVGLGPVERKHLSHTIAEIRSTVDATSPRIREILGSLQETVGGLRESADNIRPSVEAAATQIGDITKRFNASAPKIETTLARLDTVTGHVEGLLVENRTNIKETMASVRDLTATLQAAAQVNRPRVEQLIVNLDGTRARADRLLYQADMIAGQGVQIVTKNRADLERTISNVRDATDWADKLVQKIFANPFVLSPLYKPTAEDLRVQTVYDTAQVFTKGAQELNDMVKTLDALQAKAVTPAQQEEVAQVRRHIEKLAENLNQTSQLLADGLKKPAAPGRARR